MFKSCIDFGLVKIAAVSPKVHLANVPANVREIGEALNRAAAQNAAIVAFPELALTGATCGDLFFQTKLADEVESGLSALAKLTSSLDVTAIVGAPLRIRGRVYNCAVVLSGGAICGIVPKTFLSGEQKRWFASACELTLAEIGLCGYDVPVGTDLIFENKFFRKLSFGIEIGADSQSPESPGGKLARAGTPLTFSLSASGALVGRARSLREAVKTQSARCLAACVYAGAGTGESTTDSVFGGECFIAKNGEMLAEAKRFSAGTEMVFAQIDVDLLAQKRCAKPEFFAGAKDDFRRVRFALSSTHTDFAATVFGKISSSPFVPAETCARAEVCREAFEIQVAGLVRRLAHTQAKNVVLGISGGLDSTLAILVAKEAFARLGLDLSGIYGYSLPGPGTSARTRKNALDLMAQLGIEAREIPIVSAVEQHLRDIGQPENCYDAAFENAQARERTQILMDLANRLGGFVVGTGDLSEAALGWCTFNGDQMSMYHVNIGVPKTLIRHIIAWFAAEKNDAAVAKTLADIIDTPISPELKPPDASGEIAQKTEDLVGPYELHDFFIYHFCGNGFSPEKIFFLAQNAFAGTFEAGTIEKWLKVFLRRFFSQQFKRSACPDGPQVVEIGLSPRGGWLMPSDAESAMWL